MIFAPAFWSDSGSDFRSAVTAVPVTNGKTFALSIIAVPVTVVPVTAVIVINVPESVVLIQILYSVIDHPPDLLIGPAAAFLAVAAPAQALKIINVFSRAALRNGLNMICLKQKIIP